MPEEDSIKLVRLKAMPTKIQKIIETMIFFVNDIIDLESKAACLVC